MNFEEAMSADVSHAEAEREIIRHHLEPAEFFLEVGDRSQYTGEEVLGWLGY